MIKLSRSSSGASPTLSEKLNWHFSVTTYVWVVNVSPYNTTFYCHVYVYIVCMPELTITTKQSASELAEQTP